MTDQPSFWILDACTPDGRFGMATTTCASWWRNDFGRIYVGPTDAWGAKDMCGDAPVSLTFCHARSTVPCAWIVLGARGLLYHLFTNGVAEAKLPVTGPMRRLRSFGDELVAVGSGGQVFRGRRTKKLAAVPDLLDPARYLVDLDGPSGEDLCVVGRHGEVFHWDGHVWNTWSPGGADLHVVTRFGDKYIVGGDGGRVLVREADAWRTVTVPTSEPIVGLAEHAGVLWAATPTAVLCGDATGVDRVEGPGFGGRLAVSDGVLYCVGVAYLARLVDSAWQRVPHPDQHYAGGPPPWPSLADSFDASRSALVDPAANLGGKLFTEDDIGPRALGRWAKLSRSPVQSRELLGSPGLYRVLEVKGDLHVRGDLDTFALKLVGLVVHGDLIVDGMFCDRDSPVTITLVGGSLRARTIFTSGQLEVNGTVDCEHLIGAGNHYSARLHGPVNARLFAPEHHWFEVAGPVRAELCVGAVDRVPPALAASVREASGAELSAALRDEVLCQGDEAQLDREAVLRALRAGKSIWRASSVRTAMRT